MPSITFDTVRRYFLDSRSTLTKLFIPFLLLAIFVFFYCLIRLDLNLFALGGLMLGIECYLLSYIILAFGTQKIHKIWALFNMAIGIWGIGTFVVGISKDQAIILWAWKIAYIGILLLPVFLYHTIYIFCGLEKKWFLSFVYIQGITILLLDLMSNLMFKPLIYVFNSIYYHKATLVYFLVFILWSILVCKCFYELYKYVNRVQGLRKIQALYLYWGTLIGFIGGASTVAPAFKINLYPFGYFIVCIYAAISTYAIFKYHLMDIRIAFTRFGVFIVVYSIVLGIPYGLAILGRDWLEKTFGESWLWFPMNSLLVLATVGPFIYLFLQRKTENRLLQEERRMQDLLNRASVGMRTIRNLHKLLEWIVDVLAKSLGLGNASIYLHDPVSNQFVLNVSRREQVANVKIDKNDPLILSLEETKYPLIYEELKLSSESQNADEDLREIIRQMTELEASVIVPAIAEDILLGFIILGERKDKRIYTADLINVLSVLGNQAALAIENAIFHKEAQKDLSQRSHEARLKSMGAMGSGVAHQIRNRLNILTGTVSMFLEELENENLEDITKEKAVELLKSAQKIMNKIIENTLLAERICTAINSYSKLSRDKEFAEIGCIVEMAVDLLQGRNDMDIFKLEKDFPEDVKVYVIIPMIQDIFVNLIVNSRDSIQAKLNYINRGEWDNSNYQPKIIIKGFVNKDKVIVDISDNGTGFKPEEEKNAFVPFYTTKATGIKGKDGGTGLGLSLIWDFLKQNNGDIEIINNGYKEGVTFRITLPTQNNERKSK